MSETPETCKHVVALKNGESMTLILNTAMTRCPYCQIDLVERRLREAEEVVLSEKFMAQMRKNYSIDKNGDPVGAEPDVGWETGYAAGIRCFYRTLRDIYAAAPKEQKEKP